MLPLSSPFPDPTLTPVSHLSRPLLLFMLPGSTTTFHLFLALSALTPPFHAPAPQLPEQLSLLLGLTLCGRDPSGHTFWDQYRQGPRRGQGHRLCRERHLLPEGKAGRSGNKQRPGLVGTPGWPPPPSIRSVPQRFPKSITDGTSDPNEVSVNSEVGPTVGTRD